MNVVLFLLLSFFNGHTGADFTNVHIHHHPATATVHTLDTVEALP